jgi:alpha-D-xyloside xylohydrolase
MRPKFLLNAFICLLSMTVFCQLAIAQSERNTTINEPVDISPDFKSFTNAYFLADSLSSFNSNEMSGTVKWQRNRYSRRMAFNNEMVALYPAHNEIFPGTEAFNLFLQEPSG